MALYRCYSNILHQRLLRAVRWGSDSNVRFPPKTATSWNRSKPASLLFGCSREDPLYDEGMTRSSQDKGPRSIVLPACIGSAVIWIFALMAFLAMNLGDCFQNCAPHRQVGGAWVLIGATVLNVSIILAMVRANRRRPED